MENRPVALFESFLPGPEGRSFRFDGLEQVLVAATPEDVLPLLVAVEAAVATGRHAAGFVSFDAAPGIDPALSTHPQETLPLAWFGLFTERHEVLSGTTLVAGICQLAMLPADWNEARYTEAFQTVKEYIASGDSYQVNLTFSQRFRFAGEPFALYRKLCAAQPVAFCSYLDLGDVVIASASPELFFARQGEEVTMRPMKGTALRGSDPQVDKLRREELATSAKEQAENLMIVDLVRNDLGRVAVTGSVAVPALFDIESYPTLHQMTSTVTARLRGDVSFSNLFQALFPCGSVTGAPKRRSMEIIRELETGPRGLYCGALGFVSPGDEAVFSVAIRTAVLDLKRGIGELGVGSGVTTDADAATEYRECQNKAAFVVSNAEPLQLVETLLWDERRGYLLLERHLQRLTNSAAELGFLCNRDEVMWHLQSIVPSGAGHHKVRLLLDTNGAVTITTAPIAPRIFGVTLSKVALAAECIDPREPLLYHKTTWRPWYDGALDRHPGCVDVLFCNTHGEVTEGTIHNLVIAKDGLLVTPPAACGLLPGTLRQDLLERGIVSEAVISRQDLFMARRLWLVNSVRGWQRVRLLSEGDS